ncbi:MAG: DUF1854 domain-containing protein [Rhodoferax sp.]|nr:DUF1854 domain-containing protein [Rhodoferax sp.]
MKDLSLVPAAGPADPTVTSTRFCLLRDAFGKLVLTTAQGDRFEGVVPVRAFPIQSPEEGLSMLSLEGHEVAWIDQLDTLPEPAQSLVREELASREFMPILQKILAVSSFSTPCTWSVRTDRGDTDFVLRGDEDIRRIGKAGSLLISDNHGIQYFVKDQFALDAHSKKILDRFM